MSELVYQGLAALGAFGFLIVGDQLGFGRTMTALFVLLFAPTKSAFVVGLWLVVGVWKKSDYMSCRFSADGTHCLNRCSPRGIFRDDVTSTRC